MAFSTFSGPIRSGTVRYGGVTGGQNVGVPTLTQTASIASSVMITSSPVAQRLFVLPAGSKIIRFNVEKLVTIAGNSVSAVNTTIGNAAVLGAAGQTLTAASANSYMTTIDIGLTTAQTARATLDAALVSSAANNIGLYDVPITATFTAATGNPTSGSVVITVEYIQRLANGTTSPTSFIY